MNNIVKHSFAGNTARPGVGDVRGERRVVASWTREDTRPRQRGRGYKGEEAQRAVEDLHGCLCPTMRMSLKRGRGRAEVVAEAVFDGAASRLCTPIMADPRKIIRLIRSATITDASLNVRG